MRISDWSSDVCSSDLGEALPGGTVVDDRQPHVEGEPAVGLVEVAEDEVQDEGEGERRDEADDEDRLAPDVLPEVVEGDQPGRPHVSPAAPCRCRGGPLPRRSEARRVGTEGVST